jgi:hypothetical protein
MRSMTFCDCLVRSFALCLLPSLSLTNAKNHSVDIVMQFTSTTPRFISERCSAISIQFGQCEDSAAVVHEVTSVTFNITPRIFQRVENLVMEAIRNSGSGESFWNEANMNGLNILGSLDESCQDTFQHLGHFNYLYLVLGSVIGLVLVAALVDFIKFRASPLQSIFDKNESIAPLESQKCDRFRKPIAYEMFARNRKRRTDLARSTLWFCEKEDRFVLERASALLKKALLDKALVDKKVAKLEQEIRRLSSGTTLMTDPLRNFAGSYNTVSWASEERSRLHQERQGNSDTSRVNDDISLGHRNNNLHLEITSDDTSTESATIRQPLMSPMSFIICDESGENDSEYLTAMTDIKQKLAEELAGVSLLLPLSLSESVKSISCRLDRNSPECTRDSINESELDFEKECTPQSFLKNATSEGLDDSSLARRMFF